LLSEILRQLGRELPRGDVAAASWGERHNHPDRLCRILLRLQRLEGRKQQGGSQKLVNLVHVAFLRIGLSNTSAMPQKVIQSLACAILHNFIKKCNMGRKSHGRHIAVCFRIMKTATRLTSLQQKVAREIVALVRRENRLAGHHLSKLALAKAIGTSHNPVEAALAHLARVGIARHEKDRGYFLARDASRLGTAAEKLMPADDPLYRRILDLRLDRHLSDTISETGLTRRLGATRSAVHKALVRIQQEGWIERRAGHGWAFLPLIDSVESYEDNFEMRRIIEPACILGRRFAADPAELDTLKRQQAFMASGGYGEMTPVEWADINAHFTKPWRAGLATASCCRPCAGSTSCAGWWNIGRFPEIRKHAHGRQRNICAYLKPSSAATAAKRRVCCAITWTARAARKCSPPISHRPENEKNPDPHTHHRRHWGHR
jgi:DNA-binding GntR family transcriptional regulator